MTDRIQQTADLVAIEDWWRDDEVMGQIKALWGDTINDHGVFVRTDDETLFNKDRFKAAIEISEAHGVYAFGVDFQYPTGGFRSAPSVSGALFTSRDEARTAAIQYLLDRIPKQLFPNEKSLGVQFDRIRSTLQSLVAQPTLF